MIKNKADYKNVMDLFNKDLKNIKKIKNKMKKIGINKSQIKLAIDPLISFAFKLKEDLKEYKKKSLKNTKK